MSQIKEEFMSQIKNSINKKYENGLPKYVAYKMIKSTSRNSKYI